MQPLDQDSELFENYITDTMLSKSHSIIVLNLSGIQYMSIFKTGTVSLKCTCVVPLTENITLITLNQFKIYWEITPNSSDLAP